MPNIDFKFKVGDTAYVKDGGPEQLLISERGASQNQGGGFAKSYKAWSPSRFTDVVVPEVLLTSRVPQSVTGPQESTGPEALIRERDGFRKTMLAAISQADITRREKRQLRLMLFFSPDRMKEAVIGTLAEEGHLDPTQAFGENFPWQDFFAFILELVPLLVSLFGIG